MDDERRLILNMISEGKITAEQGLELLQALSSAHPEDQDVETAQPGEDDLLSERNEGFDATGDLPGTVNHPQMPALPPYAKKWQRWWIIPFWSSIAFAVISGSVMIWIMRTSGTGFWFYCLWVPLLLGVALSAYFWQSRAARWLHLRIASQAGEKPRQIAISIPLPLRFAARMLRPFQKYIPGLENVSLDTLLKAIDEAADAGQPFYINAQDEEDGDQVEIFIG